MKKVAYLIPFLVLMLTGHPAAQDSLQSTDNGVLSGVLPPVVHSSIYRVTGDVFVSPGSSVTIEAGTVFLFQEFTGLHVQGSLFVSGDSAHPVIFTSKNDSQYNDSSKVTPAPFDWNGIDVYETALGTTFSHCKIMYSVFGIRSQIEYVKLEQCSFSNNGKSDFLIKNEQKTIDAQPYTYTYTVANPQPKLSIAPVTEEYKDSTLNKPSMQMEEKIHEKKGGKLFFRYTGLILFLGGGASAGYFADKYMKAQKKFEDVSDLDATEKYTLSSEDWNAAKKERDRNLMNTSICGGISFVGLTTFILSFAF